MKEIYRLFIDDEREPVGNHWIIVRTQKEAIDFFERYGCPQFISFDHDLGGNETGMEIAKYMVNKDLDMRESGMEFFHHDFSFEVHSQNPVGKANIENFLKGYLKHK